MNDCPNCEYHRQRAQNWREEAYKLSGHPLPERDESGWRKRQIAELNAEFDSLYAVHKRNEVLEEVAKEFDKMKSFGDTSASFAVYVREMKR
jgi:hypothetical protein